MKQKNVEIPKQKNVEMPKHNDGSENKKYIDVLDEDRHLNGQNFVCLSFVSPENILKQKEKFFFNEFIKGYDKETSIKRFFNFLNYLSHIYELDMEDMTKEFNTFLKEEDKNIFNNELTEEYKNFLDKNEDKLQELFDQENQFQTSVRGLKVRGVFEDIDEAKLRAESLRESDPYNQIYVGEVGKWMPWEPVYYKTGQVEYLEPELNQLMHEKAKSEKEAKQKFDQRVTDAKKSAIEDNIKRAEESGNVLTQNVNEDGELVSVGSANTQMNIFNNQEDVDSADIKKELFEGNNIRTKDFDKQNEDPVLTNIKKNNK
jgi:hypothetical protein